MPTTISRTVFHDGKPTPVESVREDLLRHGVPQAFIDNYLATAVPFEGHDDQARIPAGQPGGGQFAPQGGDGGGGGGGGKGLAERVADKVESGVASGIKSVVMAPVRAAQRAVSNTGRSLVESLKGASDWARESAAQFQQVTNLPLTVFHGVGIACGKEVREIAKADGDRHRKEFGEFTGNLIMAASHMVTAAIQITPAVVGAMIPAAVGMANPIAGLAAGWAMGSLAGLAARHMPSLGKFMPSPKDFIPNVMAGVAGMVFGGLRTAVKIGTLGHLDPKSLKTQSEIDYEHAEHQKKIQASTAALAQHLTGKAAFSAALFAQAAATDRDHVLTLSQAEIMAKAKETAQNQFMAGLKGILGNVDFWKQSADALVKKDPSLAAKLTALSVRPKAAMSVWLDGQKATYYQAVAELVAAGFNDHDAELQADGLAICFG